MCYTEMEQAHLHKQAGSQQALQNICLGKAKKQAGWVLPQATVSLQLYKRGLCREAYH